MLQLIVLNSLQDLSFLPSWSKLFPVVASDKVIKKKINVYAFPVDGKKRQNKKMENTAENPHHGNHNNSHHRSCTNTWWWFYWGTCREAGGFFAAAAFVVVVLSLFPPLGRSERCFGISNGLDYVVALFCVVYFFYPVPIAFANRVPVKGCFSPFVNGAMQLRS